MFKLFKKLSQALCNHNYYHASRYTEYDIFKCNKCGHIKRMKRRA